MYIGHYQLSNSKQVRKEENAMLEYKFPQGKFRRNDPKDLFQNTTLMFLFLGHMFMNSDIISYFIRMKHHAKRCRKGWNLMIKMIHKAQDHKRKL